MNRNEAYKQIIEAVDNHENAKITRASLQEIITETIDAVANESHSQGYDECEQNLSDDEDGEDWDGEYDDDDDDEDEEV